MGHTSPDSRYQSLLWRCQTGGYSQLRVQPAEEEIKLHRQIVSHAYNHAWVRGLSALQTNLMLWHCDSVTLWHCDTQTVWFCDTLTLWCCDNVTPWRRDTVTVWFCDTVTVWFCDTVMLWQCDTSFVTPELCMKSPTLVVSSWFPWFPYTLWRVCVHSTFWVVCSELLKIFQSHWSLPIPCISENIVHLVELLSCFYTAWFYPVFKKGGNSHSRLHSFRPMAISKWQWCPSRKACHSVTVCCCITAIQMSRL